MLHDLGINSHELLPGAAQAVQRPRLDAAFYHSLIQIISSHSGDQILQILKGPCCPSLR